MVSKKEKAIYTHNFTCIIICADVSMTENGEILKFEIWNKNGSGGMSVNQMEARPALPTNPIAYPGRKLVHLIILPPSYGSVFEKGSFGLIFIYIGELVRQHEKTQKEVSKERKRSISLSLKHLWILLWFYEVGNDYLINAGSEAIFHL